MPKLVRGRIVKERSELETKDARWHLLSDAVEGLVSACLPLLVSCLILAANLNPDMRAIQKSKAESLTARDMLRGVGVCAAAV